MLEQRNLEPLAKQQQWCDGERSEPRIRQADGRQRSSQCREQELGAEAKRRRARQPACESAIGEERRKLVRRHEGRASRHSCERPGGFPVEEHRRQRHGGGGGEPRQRRGRNLGRQFVEAGETRRARPHDPARHRDDECQRDKKIEWEQDCARRQHEDSCPMTGTCAVSTRDERMRRYAEQREADESSPVVRGCSSCKGREEHGGGGSHGQGENCRLDAARARRGLRCSCHCH